MGLPPPGQAGISRVFDPGAVGRVGLLTVVRAGYGLISLDRSLYMGLYDLGAGMVGWIVGHTVVVVNNSTLATTYCVKRRLLN